MKLTDRIVTSMPLEQLWNDEVEFAARRGSYLSIDDIKQLLRQGPVQFVVADVGHKLQWIGLGECYNFWKDEVEKHLVRGEDRIIPEQYPGEYAYVATAWVGGFDIPVVVLERLH